MLQTYLTAQHIPWSLKGGMGALSDGFPIFGYRKRYYILFHGALACVAFFCLAWFEREYTPLVAVVLAFVYNYQVGQVLR